MKRRLFLALAACVCLALFLAAREAASWRPQVLGVVAGATNLSLSPDGQILLDMNGTSNNPALFAADTGRLLRGLPRARVHVFSPDSQIIAVVSDNQGQTPNRKGVTYTPGARFLDVQTGRTIRVLRTSDQLTENWTSDAAFSPDGKRFVIVTPRSFYEFDATTGQFLHRAVPQTAFDSTPEHTHSHNISPDARRVIASDKFARIYDIQSGKIIHSLRLGEFGADNLGWSPDGTRVWESYGGMSVRFWSARSGKLIRQWRNISQTNVLFTPDSKTLAVVKGNRLELRDVLTGKTVRTLPGPRAEPFAIAPDGTFALSVEGEKLLRWRLK